MPLSVTNYPPDVRRHTLATWAEGEGLHAGIWEKRVPAGDPTRYCARMIGVSVRVGRMRLADCAGHGATKQAALDALCSELSNKPVLIYAEGQERREKNVPVLEGVGPWEEEGRVPSIDDVVRVP